MVEVLPGCDALRSCVSVLPTTGQRLVTSGAEEGGGRNGCGLWLSTRRVGREHLTIVHSSPSVLLVAVRSQTVEANVVVAHSPVEGRERAEEWWETLSELLLSFVNDAPTYVCIDANGRLGSPTSKHVGSLSADQETPGERLHRFLVVADLCAVNTVFCEGDGATWVPTRGRPRRIDFVAVSLPEMLRVKKCWVASELDVATVRDDHYPVVVDLETFVCLPKKWQPAA